MSLLALYLAIRIPVDHNVTQLAFAGMASAGGFEWTSLLTLCLTWSIGIGLCWTLYWRKESWFRRFKADAPQDMPLDTGALARMTLLLLGAWIALDSAIWMLFEVHDLWLRWPGEEKAGQGWREWLETRAMLGEAGIDWVWYLTRIVLGLGLFAFSSPIARWFASQWPQEPPLVAAAEPSDTTPEE